MARLLFFGKLGDVAGGRARDFALGDISTLVALKTAIAKTDPDLGAALGEPSVRCIVNEVVSPGDAPISDADEIAFIPPVSGG